MPDLEKPEELKQEFQKAMKAANEGREYALVVESCALYDTILLSNTFYGQETSVRGWFTSFANFAASRDLRFFKSRTEGTAGLPYTNMQSADSMPFPFLAYTMGITFFAPASNIMGDTEDVVIDGANTIATQLDPAQPHYWQFDLPNHSSISFRTNQDVRAELPCYACPPGYGPLGGGAAFEINTYSGGFAAYKQRAQMVTFGTQGVPDLGNRFRFPVPIAIPKSATIEGELEIHRGARGVLEDWVGPQNYLFQTTNTGPAEEIEYKFPARYGIQFSLFGYRLVQRRGNYNK